ncbi:MAG: hypothetical protein KAH22_00605 [Thiotrichaceae bacterium]|nr:hypothetical protein [Thiotrichaceae bacterium]
MINHHKQSGVVLITTLLVVIILTILVLTTARTTILQEKMTSNLRERDLAFQSAESALLEGQQYLEQTDPLPVFSSANGRHSFNKTVNFKNDSAWANITTTQYSKSLHQVESAPKYVIEKIALVNTIGESLDSSTPEVSNYYRISSKSVNGKATVILQSIYRR